MGTPRIVAVSTATPRHRFDQATLLRMAGYEDSRRAGFFANSEIDGPHLYLDPETFTPRESVDELSERFRRGSIELGAEAVRRVVERAGWDLADVDFLATTTCTGRLCPSLDAHLIAELGLKDGIQRVHVGDTGCASAMVALQQAHNHVRAFPRHRAVVVAVEICSTAYFLDDRLESAVAHAIFADGAGAMAIAGEGDGRPPHGLAGAQEGGRASLRAAFGGPPGDRAGAPAPRPRRIADRPLAPRAAPSRQHVLGHRG